MKKIILLISSLTINCLFTVSCAKKNDAPKFKLLSQGVVISEKASFTIPINRKDRNSGPVIEIVADDPSPTRRIARIICRDLEFKLEFTDNTFKVDDNHFPTLIQLPTQASCTLNVSLTNTNNATFVRDLPIRFEFDSSQDFNITRLVSVTGRGSPVINNANVLLEQYTIKNNFSYPLGFTYTARDYMCAGVNLNGRSGPFPFVRYDAPGDQVSVWGPHSFWAAGSANYVNFVIQPGDQVYINLYGGAVAANAKLVNLLCTNYQVVHNLTTWRDFSYTKDDEQNPLRVEVLTDKTSAF